MLIYWRVLLVATNMISHDFLDGRLQNLLAQGWTQHENIVQRTNGKTQMLIILCVVYKQTFILFVVVLFQCFIVTID